MNKTILGCLIFVALICVSNLSCANIVVGADFSKQIIDIQEYEIEVNAVGIFVGYNLSESEKFTFTPELHYITATSWKHNVSVSCISSNYSKCDAGIEYHYQFFASVKIAYKLGKSNYVFVAPSYGKIKVQTGNPYSLDFCPNDRTLELTECDNHKFDGYGEEDGLNSYSAAIRVGAGVQIMNNFAIEISLLTNENSSNVFLSLSYQI